MVLVGPHISIWIPCKTSMEADALDTMLQAFDRQERGLFRSAISAIHAMGLAEAKVVGLIFLVREKLVSG